MAWTKKDAKDDWERMMFRELTDQEENHFREQARKQFHPEVEISAAWHPVYRDEWLKEEWRRSLRKAPLKTPLKEFVAKNRKVIDLVIKHLCPDIGSIDDEARRQWTLNDEGLYLWARSEGADV